MNINHRAEAERHLSQASHVSSPNRMHPIDPVTTDFHLRMAAVHATLAGQQETQVDTSGHTAALVSWRNVVTHAVAWGICFAETDEQHEPWWTLARHLDEAGLSINADVNRIAGDFGKNPVDIWLAPSVSRAKRMSAHIDVPF